VKDGYRYTIMSTPILQLRQAATNNRLTAQRGRSDSTDDDHKYDHHDRKYDDQDCGDFTTVPYTRPNWDGDALWDDPSYDMRRGDMIVTKWRALEVHSGDYQPRCPLQVRASDVQRLARVARDVIAAIPVSTVANAVATASKEAAGSALVLSAKMRARAVMHTRVTDKCPTRPNFRYVGPSDAKSLAERNTMMVTRGGEYGITSNSKNRVTRPHTMSEYVVPHLGRVGTSLSSRDCDADGNLVDGYIRYESGRGYIVRLPSTVVDQTRAWLAGKERTNAMQRMVYVKVAELTRDLDLTPDELNTTNWYAPLAAWALTEALHVETTYVMKRKFVSSNMVAKLATAAISVTMLLPTAAAATIAGASAPITVPIFAAGFAAVAALGAGVAAIYSGAIKPSLGPDLAPTLHTKNSTASVVTTVKTGSSIEKLDDGASKMKPYDAVVEYTPIGISDRQLVPIVLATNSFNEELALRARVTAPTPTPDPDTISDFTRFFKANIDQVIGRSGRPFRILARDFTSWLDNCHCNAATKTIYADTREQLTQMGIGPDTALSKTQLSSWTIRKAFVKKETTLHREAQKAPRLIQGAQPQMTVLCGPWVAAFQGYVKEMLHPSRSNLVFGAGLDQRAAAEFIGQFENRGTIIEDDVSAYDASIGRYLCELEVWLCTHYGAPRQVTDLLTANIATRGYTRGGFKYSVDGTRKSGDVTTSVMNTLLNIMMHLYIYCSQHGRSVDQARTELFVLANGDDDVMIDLAKRDTDWRLGMLHLGFSSKPIVREHMDQVEFCSHALMPTTYPEGDGWAFVYKLGRLISKSSVSKDSLDKQRALRVLRGVANSMRFSTSCSPPHHAFVQRLLVLTSGETQIELPKEPWRLGQTSSGTCNDRTRIALERRYGWTPNLQQQWEAELATIKQCPSFGDYPICREFQYRDSDAPDASALSSTSHSGVADDEKSPSTNLATWHTPGETVEFRINDGDTIATHLRRLGMSDCVARLSGVAVSHASPVSPVAYHVTRPTSGLMGGSDTVADASWLDDEKVPVFPAATNGYTDSVEPDIIVYVRHFKHRDYTTEAVEVESDSCLVDVLDAILGDDFDTTSIMVFVNGKVVDDYSTYVPRCGDLIQLEAKGYGGAQCIVKLFGDAVVLDRVDNVYTALIEAEEKLGYCGVVRPERQIIRLNGKVLNELNCGIPDGAVITLDEKGLGGSLLATVVGLLKNLQPAVADAAVTAAAESIISMLAPHPNELKEEDHLATFNGSTLVFNSYNESYVQCFMRLFNVPQHVASVCTLQVDGRPAQWNEVVRGSFTVNMKLNGGSNVSRSERMLKKVLDNAGVLDSSRGALLCYGDPFHDHEFRSEGYPDHIGTSSVPQCYKTTVTISSNQGPTANWDCNIVLDPSLVPTLQCAMNSVASYGGSIPAQYRLPTNGFVSPTVLGGNQVPGNLSGYPTGGLCVYQGLAGAVLDPTTVSGAYPVLPTQATTGASRVYGYAVELINNTATLYQQGTIACWRQPMPDPGSATTINCVYPTSTTGPNYGNISGSVSAVFSPNPPETIAEAMLLDGTRQWHAKEGAMVVSTMNSSMLPIINNQCITRVAYPDSPLDTSVYINMPLNDTYLTIIGSGTGATYGTAYFPRTYLIPFNMGGIYITGLSAQSSFAANIRVYCEPFPSQLLNPLTPLAQPSAPADYAALQVFAEMARDMPPGVMLCENGFGDFFGDLAQKIKGFIAPVANVVSRVASFIPHPAAQAVARISGVVGDVAGNMMPASEQAYNEPKRSLMPITAAAAPRARKVAMKKKPKKKATKKAKRM
jgi:hypothetical protein